jgi:hypothetical protein
MHRGPVKTRDRKCQTVIPLRSLAHGRPVRKVVRFGASFLEGQAANLVSIRKRTRVGSSRSGSYDVHLDGELDQLGAGLDAEQLHHGVLVEGDGPRVIFSSRAVSFIVCPSARSWSTSRWRGLSSAGLTAGSAGWISVSTSPRVASGVT